MSALRPSRSHTSSTHAVLLVCIVAILLTGTAFAKQAKPPKEHRRTETREIEALEQEWRTALLRADTNTMDKLLADDFLSVSSNGTLADKQQYIARLGSHTNKFASLDLLDLKVRVRPGTAVAISQTHLIGSIDGHDVDGLFRNTRVYGRSTNGQWQILNSEATRVSGRDEGDGEMEGGTPLRVPSAAR